MSLEISQDTMTKLTGTVITDYNIRILYSLKRYTKNTAIGILNNIGTYMADSYYTYI